MELREIIAFTLFFSLDGDGIKDIENQYQRWLEIYKPRLNNEHSGDCRQEPWTCHRCLVENLYKEADAIASLLTPQRAADGRESVEQKTHSGADSFPSSARR